VTAWESLNWKMLSWIDDDLLTLGEVEIARDEAEEAVAQLQSDIDDLRSARTELKDIIRGLKNESLDIGDVGDSSDDGED
jgi:prefoldin subunit 5